MNYLFTVNTYYPLKDGVQFVTEYHAENLVKLGHKVTVVTLAHGNENKRENHNGVEIIRIDAFVKHALYYGDKKAYRSLILDLSKSADVLITVCTQCPTTDWLLECLDDVPCKKILYLHGIHDFRWRREHFGSVADFGHKLWNNIRWSFLYRKLKKYVYKYDEIVQLHKFDYGYEFFERKYGAKCSVIENAADEAFFKDYEGSILAFDIKSMERYIVCVANYMDGKNQKMVLNAFFETEKSNDVSLVFIGSSVNSYYNELVKAYESLKKKYGNRKVLFLHGISRAETIAIIKNAWIYAFGSKKEVFPISIIESMASGKPFISTNVGCVRFLPGGVIANDVRELSYWIDFFSLNSWYVDALGKAGKKYAYEHYTPMTKTIALEKLVNG